MTEEFKQKVIENCLNCPQKDNITGYCIKKCDFGFEIYWGCFSLLGYLRGDGIFAAD